MWAPLAEREIETPCAQEKLANWEMASKQTTLGVFFSLSKESVRNSREPKASAESTCTKGKTSDSESVSETLNDCASGSTSDSTSRSTQSEKDRIQPSTQDCTCQCYSHPEEPYHPSDLSESKIRHKHHSKGRQMGQKKSYQRKIQSSWFVK